MATTLLLPKSSGHVRIHSANPFTYPTIQPNYLSDAEGVRTRLVELEPRGGYQTVWPLIVPV